jgi:hypothetical protein
MRYDENKGSGERLLTKAIRKRLLHTVTDTADREDRAQADVNVPLYPDAVPDIDDHIEALAGLVLRVDPDGTRTAQEMPDRICGVCPHQFPRSYCPLRPRGGCRLYRLALPISAALALELDTPALRDRFIDFSERCHGQDAR